MGKLSQTQKTLREQGERIAAIEGADRVEGEMMQELRNEIKALRKSVTILKYLGGLLLAVVFGGEATMNASGSGFVSFFVNLATQLAKNAG